MACEPAILSGGRAALEVVGMGTVYVASVYCVPKRYRELPRDSSGHIYARFASVSAASMVAVAEMARATEKGACWGGVGRALGVHGGIREAWRATAWCLALTWLLYFGPITAYCVEAAAHVRIETESGCGFMEAVGRVASRSLEDRVRLARYGPRAAYLRNLAFGPASEELVFRGCVLPVLLASGLSLTRTILTSPLVFGIAHLHHMKRRLDEGAPLSEALLATLVQLGYTTLFGFYTAFVFARTGHLIAAIACHAYCNHVGLPDLDFLWHPDRWLYYGASPRDRRVALAVHHARRPISFAYLLGIAAFAGGLFPFTEPARFDSAYWPH